ncbi:hypothetical protein D9613_006245 [Agrocybe pediades]|uniref:P-loop containing nucleoside triphosphate hydrolase protein n=1 Tax=Agrocybe pediades TaxID=84607 RepID=A0A8H4VRW7_9AGAR|nr:hypothetical protein D9613_006245 [Agrocybe pediades]
MLVFAPVKDVFRFDERLLPLAFACLSIGIIAVLWIRHASGHKPLDTESDVTTGSTLKAKVDRYVQGVGGYGILGFSIARLATTVLLTYLSLFTPTRDCAKVPWPRWGKLCVGNPVLITSLYSLFLAIVSLASRTWEPVATSHITLISLVTLGVYTYRDLWPLATYDLEPVDSYEGNILWVKIACLLTIALIIPLFIPTRYVPVDPKNPMTVLDPGQTASWISRRTFMYIDSIIMDAYKVSHLSVSQLPPLPDTEYAAYQCDLSFPHLDPHMRKKKLHLFFGLVYHFRWEYVVMMFCTVGSGISTFSEPIALKQILAYIEADGYKATIKPWFWIGLLLCGPLVTSVLQHWTLFLNTVILVRLQAILTQLAFDHSLRIRLKAESPETSSPTAEPAQSSSVSISSINELEQSATDQTDTIAPSEGSTSREPTVVEGSSESAKKKAKNEPSADASPKHGGDAENLLGRINNLVTSDMQNIGEGVDFLDSIVLIPMQITLSIVFLYKILGWSALVGLFTLIALSPVPALFAKNMEHFEGTKMKKTDARVQAITDTIGVLRMVKLFGWEDKMTKKIAEKRDEELEWIWKVKLFRLFNEVTSIIIPTLTMLFTYATYTAVMKQELTASKIFSSMSAFFILREQLHRISWQVNLIVTAKVSLDRMHRFLQDTELLDRFTPSNKDNVLSRVDAYDAGEEADSDNRIGFRNATFAWSADDLDGSLTPSSRNFRLHIEDDLFFKRNCINMIVGPTGSGKTSILMALLGEMHFIPSQANSWFNLPREGGVAYAAQESWVQSSTVRENILFGSPYEEERYKQVIRQCALEHDLELFDAGDQTEVGERGLTLSGGQKARVTLARAIYSRAEIILLDDVLAALDVHTSSWIVDKCFRGDLVKGRTVIIVTHNIALVGPVAGFCVSLGIDGRVKSQGTEVDSIIQHDSQLVAELEQDKKAIEASKQEVEGAETQGAKAQSDGKLVVAEEIATGHISWKTMNLLLSAMGGSRPLLIICGFMLAMIITEVAFIGQTWFLGFWAQQYELHAPSEVRLSYWLSGLALIIFGSMAIYAAVNIFFQYRALVASKVIHHTLVDSVFTSTFRWLDETPTARIISRCTQDVRSVDSALPQNLYWVIGQAVGIVARLTAVVMVTPLFLVPGLAVAVLATAIGALYLKAQLSIKRELSNARSPVLAHFNAVIHGLVSVRAYGVQDAFKKESIKRIDAYSRIARSSWNVNRWVGLRMDYLGAIFTASLAAYQVYGHRVSASNIGFSLNMAMAFCSYIFWFIRIFNLLEVESNSLERINDYINIDHEPKATEAGKPPAAWPTSGDLRAENLSARYSKLGPKVLHDVSFHIKSGERVGIVGRTGSGKSSLTLALLRCIITEGSVFFDGVDTSQVNLDALRSSMTIIPQVPELISGTLRQNLDPFNQNDDLTLNQALRSAGLFSLQQELGESRLTLDSKISGGGGNLSVGQRQIIALARAMVRGSKLLILDEATSAIDYKTDAIIQSTLRHALSADVTVITIAHRLQTIMDADKIMVLDNGQIAEFDSPRVLLKKEKGTLRALVDESGDKEALHKLAKV